MKTTPTVFALADPQRHAAWRPALVVGVGCSGRAVVAKASDRPGAPRLLTDEANVSDWKKSVRDLQRRPRTADSMEWNRTPRILVVGELTDLEEQWHVLHNHWHHLGDLIVCALLINSHGGGSIQDVPCYALTNEYENGQLTRGQVIDLAACLLRRDLLTVLFEFALRQEPVGTTVVGLSMGWLPEATMGSAVSCWLADAVAKRLRDGGVSGREYLPLFDPCPLASLVNRLTAVICPAHATIARGYPRAQRNDLISLAGDEIEEQRGELEEIVNRWCKEEVALIRQLVCELLSDTHVADVREFIARSILEIREHQQLLAAQHQRTLRRKAVASRQVGELDERRVRAGRLNPLIRFLFHPCRAAATRRRLREFLLARRDEVSIEYQLLALGRLLEELQGIDGRLAGLLQLAATHDDQLVNLLQPDHPNLVPLFDPATLADTVSGYAASLDSSATATATSRVWHQALDALVGEPVDDLWSHVATSARSIASSMRFAEQPFGTVCRRMLPEYQSTTLEQQLIETSCPQLYAGHGGPWNVYNRFVGQVDVHGGDGLPAMVAFRSPESL